MPINTLDPRTEDQVRNVLNKQDGSDSTWKNYWDAFNPTAITGTRPELRTNVEDLNGDAIDVNDPDIQALLADSTPDQQMLIVNSFSKQHAYKVYAKNKIREEALNNINSDPMTTQLAMGAIPALMTPSTLLPAGVISDVFKVGKAASTLARIGRGAAAAGVAAGSMGAIDELMFEQQGIEGHPMSAFVYGAAFGGTIGGFGSLFAGSRAQHNAKVMQPESDTFKYDWHTDPHVTMGKDPRGVPFVANIDMVNPANVPNVAAPGAVGVGRVPQAGKSLLLDNGLMSWANSDITKVYQHASSVARETMSKLVAPVQSIYDKAGNVTIFGKTANDFKIGRKGTINRLKYRFDEAFVEAKKNYGFTGNKKQFKEVVEEVYLNEANTQSKELYTFIEQKVKEFDESYGDTLSKYLDEEVARTQRGKKPLAPDDDALETMAKAEAYKNKQRNEVKKLAEEEFYGSYKPKFAHENAAVTKAAQHIQDFFKDHLKTNKELKIAGMSDLHENRLYAPRLIDWDHFKNDINFLRSLEEDVFLALRNHPANNDMLDDKLRVLAKEYVEGMSDVNFRQNFTHDSFVAPEASGTARTLNRKFMLDEDIMSKYWIRDMDELTSRYHYQMSGRQAVSFGLGFDIGKKDGITKFMNNIKNRMLQEEGAVDNDVVRMLENTILDLSGQLRMNALSDTIGWQWTRSAMAYNSARLGSGFGGNQFIELVASAFMNGLPSLLNGRVGNSFKQAAKVLYTEGKQADDFAEFLVGTGYFEDALHTSRINRFADTEAGWNSSWVEGTLNKYNDWQYKWNGMRYFKTVMEDMSGSAAITELQRMSKKKTLTKIDKSRLALMGLDETAMRELSAELNVAVDFKKGNFNIKNMSTLNKDRLQLAVQRQMEHIVIQGDTVHLPTWFKEPTILKSLTTQFLRFPIIAHNIFLRRGLADEQARMAGAVVGSIMTYMGMQYLREQAAIKLGFIDQREAKFDYFDDTHGKDNALHGLQRGLGYTAPLGMLWNITQTGAAIGGVQLPGSKYASRTDIKNALGPTASLAQDTVSLAAKALDETGVLDSLGLESTNRMRDERAMLKAKSLAPSVFDFAIIDEGITDWIKDNF